MHSAPSVSYPVGRSRLARRLLLGLWGLGAAGVIAWCLQFSGAPWRTGLLLAALLVAGIAARRAGGLGEGVQLQWDGQQWSCTGSRQLGGAAASVHLDLQSLALVRLCAPEQSAAWLWLDRDACPARWLDLRRALHASTPAARPISTGTAA
jgi:toxin CptA